MLQANTLQNLLSVLFSFVSAPVLFSDMDEEVMGDEEAIEEEEEDKDMDVMGDEEEEDDDVMEDEDFA